MNEKKPYAPPAVAVLPLARDLLLESRDSLGENDGQSFNFNEL